MTDLYLVLGVSRRATDSEIKSAYRKLARRYHPDVCSSPDANARFARITEAYRVLSDPDRRSMYDLGVPLERKTTFYASRSAEVVAYQRKLDHLVDEMIARDRKETAERSHAVTIVVTLFISAFMVAAAKPNIIEELNKPGKIAVIALSLWVRMQIEKNGSRSIAIAAQRSSNTGCVRSVGSIERNSIGPTAMPWPGNSRCSHRQITTLAVLNQDTMICPSRGPTRKT